MNKSEEIRISKFLSLILRHRPETIGIKLDENGWADTAQVISGANRKRVHLNMKKLKEVVKKNDKQRFSLSEDYSKIRANQGHSIAVDLQLTSASLPPILYHGTVERNLGSIKESGLLSQQRHHVHLSLDTNTAKKVGSRYGKPIVLEILSGQMHEDGIKFYLSENNVWLTETVSPKYIKFP